MNDVFRGYHNGVEWRVSKDAALLSFFGRHKVPAWGFTVCSFDRTRWCVAGAYRTRWGATRAAKRMIGAEGEKYR